MAADIQINKIVTWHARNLWKACHAV